MQGRDNLREFGLFKNWILCQTVSFFLSRLFLGVQISWLDFRDMSFIKLFLVTFPFKFFISWCKKRWYFITFRSIVCHVVMKDGCRLAIVFFCTKKTLWYWFYAIFYILYIKNLSCRWSDRWCCRSGHHCSGSCGKSL